jgi:hypothetical protein
MIMQLLPVEVPPAEIKSPVGRIITPQVLSAFMAAAGDFSEMVICPYWYPQFYSHSFAP